MTVLQKTMADVAAMYEREEQVHLYPAFEIEWAIKKPGEDKTLLGIRRRAQGNEVGPSVWEVWLVS